MQILELLLMVQPLLGALGPQLARPRALDLDDLLGGGILGNLSNYKHSLKDLLNIILWYPSMKY